MKLPWRKWFASDWLSDIAVAKTSLAARGLWAEALNVMIASDSFCLEGSLPELARVLRCSESELHAAMPSLIESHVADVTQRSNGCVTLVSRRLLREDKLRKGNKLRAQRFRDEQRRNGCVTSGSVSGSVSSSDRKGGSGENQPELVVELPLGFPKSPEEAVKHSFSVGCDPEFVKKIWHKAASRGGLDARGIPIRSFVSYLQTERSYDLSRPKSDLAPWRQIEALEKAIAEHPANRDSVYHRQDCSDQEKADLRAKRAKLSELTKV